MIEIKELLPIHRSKHTTKNPEILLFSGVGDLDVYNITAPFMFEGKHLIAGRVEARESEKSVIRLFEKNNEKWQVLEESLSLTLQDPFFTKIDGKLILGGVEVFFKTADQVQWRTVLYELKDLTTAVRVFEGPLGMKDLRLKQLANQKILVLTRPQGIKGGRGKIGYTIIDKFADLTIEIVENAPLLKDQFTETEWGGANEIYLKEKKICVLGHIAKFDGNGERHYYAMSFVLDIANGAMKEAKIIAERKDFIAGPMKRPDLADVVFSGGLTFSDEETVLYAGISDAQAQKITIQNPF
ncbi:DUF1861 family protein [Enterococcus sp. LJL99]